MALRVIIVVITGGILCLDRIVLQAMISRPIVAAPLIGWILGEPQTGLVAGAFAELLWCDRFPIGAALPPNDTVVAILITAGVAETARLLGGEMPFRGLMVLTVLLFVPVGILAERLELRLWGGNGRLTSTALDDANRGDARAVGRRHWTAVLRYGLVASGTILVALPAGIALLSWGTPRLATGVMRGLERAYLLFPFIGAAVALNAVRTRGAVPLFCAAFLVTTIATDWIRGG